MGRRFVAEVTTLRVKARSRPTSGDAGDGGQSLISQNETSWAFGGAKRISQQVSDWSGSALAASGVARRDEIGFWSPP